MEKNSSATLASMDGTQNFDIIERYGIKDYPFLLWFRFDLSASQYIILTFISQDYERPLAYQGPKDADSLAMWVRKHSMTNLPRKSDQKQVEEARKLGAPAVIVLYGESDGYLSMI